MALKKKRGSRHICKKCHIKFYDLGAKEIKCPNCDTHINKLNKDSKSNFWDKTKDTSQIDNHIQLIEITDAKNKISANMYGQSIQFMNENLFSNGWYIIEDKFINNNFIDKNALYVNIENEPKNVTKIVSRYSKQSKITNFWYRQNYITNTKRRCSKHHRRYKLAKLCI